MVSIAVIGIVVLFAAAEADYSTRRCGQYRVVLDNCGPAPRPLPYVDDEPIITPVYRKPLIRLPSPLIPLPRTIRNSCTCVKTVVRPQTVRRVIVVPYVKKYLQTSHRPVVEKIVYRSRAAGCAPRTYPSRYNPYPSRYDGGCCEPIRTCGESVY